MKEMNNSSSEEFKGNFNFANILDKNEKKIAKSPISSLLQSTTQTIVNDNEENHQNSTNKDQLYKKIEELERRFETKEVNEKFERLESLLQSVIINQKSVKEQIEFKPEVPNPVIKDNKNLVVASSILSVAILLGAFILTPREKEVVAVKEPAKEVIIKKEFFTPIKYLNLRSIPSTQGKKLQVVAPNTRVEVLKSDGDWVQIEYRDYLKSTLHTGWVYDQKNLKPI